MEEKSNQQISCIEFIAKWDNKILHIFFKFPAITCNKLNKPSRQTNASESMFRGII